MIDSETQALLRERFNPDGSQLRRVQLRMLEMLKYFDRFCTEHGITYWLSSGTCIGAMRHGGFIPWDDDVDVEMTAADYRKLLRAFGTEPRDGYVMQSEANEKNYLFRFAKLRDLNSEMKELGNNMDAELRYRGVYIDVFHIVPSSSRKLHDWGIFLEKQTYSPTSRRTLKGYIIQGVKAVVFPVLTFFDHIGAGQQLRHPIGSFFTAPRSAEDLLPTVRVPFEDTMLPVPADADSYLRRIYGDYTKLPPLDTIKPHFAKVELF